MSGRPTCEEDCSGLEALRRELDACSVEKDAQIESLAHQINGMRGDLMRVDGDLLHMNTELKNLTTSVDRVSKSLETIAANTTQFMEVAVMYQNFKGFGFVVKNLGAILLAVAAVLAALVYLKDSDIQITPAGSHPPSVVGHAAKPADR